MKITRLHAIFKGQVQGVGFRWTVVEIAEEHALVGTVKNLADGSVELFAEGSKEALERFLDAVQKKSGFAKIRNVQSSYLEVESSYCDFRII